jgi:hypothetical protein
MGGGVNGILGQTEQRWHSGAGLLREHPLNDRAPVDQPVLLPRSHGLPSTLKPLPEGTLRHQRLPSAATAGRPYWDTVVPHDP